MNINTLLESLRNAIADDASTKSWTTAKYARNHKVYVGIDLRNPPGDTDYPIVNLYMIRRQVGWQLENQINTFGVVCGIYETGTTTVAGKANIVQMTSIEYIEEFRKLVETAIYGVIPAGSFLDQVEIEYEFIESYPFAFAYQEYVFSTPYSQGVNPLT